MSWGSDIQKLELFLCQKLDFEIYIQDYKPLRFRAMCGTDVLLVCYTFFINKSKTNVA